MDPGHNGRGRDRTWTGTQTVWRGIIPFGELLGDRRDDAKNCDLSNFGNLKWLRRRHWYSSV